MNRTDVTLRAALAAALLGTAVIAACGDDAGDARVAGTTATAPRADAASAAPPAGTTAATPPPAATGSAGAASGISSAAPARPDIASMQQRSPAAGATTGAGGARTGAGGARTGAGGATAGSADAASGAAKAAAAPAATAAQAGASLDRETIRRAQQRLNDAGHDAGAVDGLFGPATSAAARRFQQAKGLEPSGELDRRTLAALGITGGSSNESERSARTGNSKEQSR